MAKCVVFQELNQTIKREDPETICSSWIVQYAPRVYRYIQKNIRSETGGIDWDAVTRHLDLPYQKRWVRYRYRSVKLYENQEEVDVILSRYRSKLYTLIACESEADKLCREKIIIKLVRLSQRGNVLAQRQLTSLLTFVVDDWIDHYYYLQKWRGYTDDVEEKIKGCIRCYRYTGSFLGYLYKTLEYSGRGIVPLQKYSLDDKVLDGAKSKLDFIAAKKVDMCTHSIND